jgi:sporulation protein YtfJ
MVDVNTIVGSPIQTPDGVTLIPISKVTFGFTAGGGEYTSKNGVNAPPAFGGGSGAGVTITPIAFMVVRGTDAKILSVTPPASSSVDRIIEAAPSVIDKIADLIKKKTTKDERDPLEN